MQLGAWLFLSFSIAWVPEAFFVLLGLGALVTGHYYLRARITNLAIHYGPLQQCALRATITQCGIWVIGFRIKGVACLRYLLLTAVWVVDVLELRGR